MTQELAKKSTYQSNLTRINNTYMPQITEQLVGNGINMTEYQRQCVISAIQSINTIIQKSKSDWKQVDQSNMTNILLSVASLQLNSSAVPNEVYFQTRNVKMHDAENDKDIWVTQIEMGIEGDGNDAMLSRFGRNVKMVHRHWEVREEDGFTFPGYRGIEIEPPTWNPTGKGKVVRVVYPIEMTDGTIEYHIAERENVVYNLLAHINNNLMNETFGFVTGTKKVYGKPKQRTRYDATTEEKKEIAAKKAEITNRLQGMSLEDILADEEIQKYISPAWKSPQSREAMLVRKMRNNVVKKIPKNFENAYIAMKYQEQQDEVVSDVRKDVTENSAQITYDFDDEERLTPTKEEAEETEPIEAEFSEVPKEAANESVNEETDVPEEPVKKERGF